MTLNSGLRKISNANKACDQNESIASEFYMFGIRLPVNQKPEVSLNVKSNALCKIAIAVGEAGSISGLSILSFSYWNQKPIVLDPITDYETYFTLDLFSKEALILSQQWRLFKPQRPVVFVVNANQEGRIIEIFKNMADECAGTYISKNEMIKTLIHELILFTRRLIPLAEFNPA